MLMYFERSPTISFAPSKREDIAKFNKRTLSGVVYSMKIHAESDNEWGNFTIDRAIMILETLAENMNDKQMLKEYFGN